MGIFFVLLIWGIVGAIAAGFWTIVLHEFATQLTRRALKKQRVISHLTLFPFGCLIWAAVVFVTQAFINGTFFHCDPGLGDSFYCRFPNGYEIGMIDTLERACLYNPKTMPECVLYAGDKTDAVDRVYMMQVAGKFVFGCAERGYFLMDTSTGTHVVYASRENLAAAAAKLGYRLDLTSSEEVYRHYRFTWFDKLFLLMLFGVPGTILYRLIDEVLTIHRRERDCRFD